MPLWEVQAARMTCCRREYRPLGTVIADSIGDALDKCLAFEDQLEDDESVCVYWEPKAPSVWQLVRDPQL